MEYTAEEDAMILHMVANSRQPRWKALAAEMQKKGFNRTENGLICRYRVLPKPYEFKAVHKLMQTVMCNVRRRAIARKRGSEWQKANPEKSRAKSKKHHDAHKDEEEYKRKRKEREAKSRPVSRAREQKRYKEDIQFNLTKRLRNRMNDFILRCNGTEKAANTMSLVGCSPSELASRLSEMRSDLTVGDGHIDHIFPFACYDMESEEQQRAVCHYTNIQLLTEEENLDKGDKLPTKAMARLTLSCNWPPGVSYDDLPDIYDGWRSPLWK
jgi:hypothetical protein